MKNIETFKVKPVVAARRKKVEPTVSPKEVIQEVLDEMEASSQWNWSTESYWQDDNQVSVRYWGDWIIDPADREDPDYDDMDFEDWDWKVLSDKSSKVLKKIEDKIKNKYPEYANRLSIYGNEKEYLEIEIR